MGKPKGEEVVKDVGANLDSWYKKNGDRIKLMDDLTLDCQVCKTREAKEAIEKMMKESVKTLKVDLDSFNKQTKKQLEELEKEEKKGIDKKVQDVIDKKTTIYNKNGTTVRIKPSYKDGIPWLTLEGEF
jgi:DNA anti-recombination protein RmuC